MGIDLGVAHQFVQTVKKGGAVDVFDLFGNSVDFFLAETHLLYEKHFGKSVFPNNEGGGFSS